MIKTLNLTANTEKSISNLGGDRCRIQNRTSGTLYVSDKPNIVPCTDGVMSIPSGRGDYFPYSMTSDTVYLLSESGGNVEISGEHYYRPFDSAAVTGGKAVGNPVVMDGLQGGVPFSEITVNGEDTSGKELTLNVCGKNLIPYPYQHTTLTINGISWTDNGDGSVTANGTATKQTWFTLFSSRKLKAGTYTLSGNPSGGRSKYDINLVWTDSNGIEHWVIDYGQKNTFTIPDCGKVNVLLRVYAGVSVENILFRPQLELGTAATAYEPYSGAEYKLTPDSNPYTVPTDIRQLEGKNTLYIADSSAKLSVRYSKANADLKRIWDKLDELTTAIIVSSGE